jgi:GDP/UDP-N,N'-diacetylbacillosamine 2-epimerase (hydrolysing)
MQTGARRIVSISGTRADYGLMQPVHRALASNGRFELHLIVTGMHLVPDFASSLAEVRADGYGIRHEVDTLAEGDDGAAMARSLGNAVVRLAPLLGELRPDALLLHGDRSEMLAGAIAAAHMNIAVVHMSGGDRSGSIDDSARNAISKLAHFHLTSCEESTRRLLELGESADRIVEVGDPALDRLRDTAFLPLEMLAGELNLPPGEQFVVATLHPVSDEADSAAQQMAIVLEALEGSGMTAVFSYPNTDAGGGAMRAALESWRGKPFLRIEPNLGSRRYLSLLRHAAAVVGNSSSGIIESPSLRIPAINIGSRQHGRLRAANVLDVPFDRDAIRDALHRALHDASFRKQLAECRSPFGDGHAAERTVDILARLRLGPQLTAKWRTPNGSFLEL